MIWSNWKLLSNGKSQLLVPQIPDITFGRALYTVADHSVQDEPRSTSMQQPWIDEEIMLGAMHLIFTRNCDCFDLIASWLYVCRWKWEHNNQTVQSAKRLSSSRLPRRSTVPWFCPQNTTDNQAVPSDSPITVGHYYTSAVQSTKHQNQYFCSHYVDLTLILEFKLTLIILRL